MNATLASLPWSGPPPLGSTNGTVDEVLFPGLYDVQIYWYGWTPGAMWIATSPIRANFDRGLDILHGPGSFTLPPAAFEAWTISASQNSTDFELYGTMATTACNFELAVLSPPALLALQSGTGTLESNGSMLLEAEHTSACIVGSSPTAFGPGVMGPFAWTSGDAVVFQNQAGASAELELIGPLEVSYVLG
jgi:hypothetical protein